MKSKRLPDKPRRPGVAFRPVVVTLLLFAVLPGSVPGERVMRTLQKENTGAELIQNGGFDQAPGGELHSWNTAPRGFALAPGEGRGGSQAVRCDNTDGKGWYGVSQSVTLNATNTLPLLVRGWSKAANVSGGSDNDYSLYVDLLYRDGIPLWGQTANFHAGTHDWERKELMIVPEKPVKSLTLHCLFRNHSGKAWFDDISITELSSNGEAVLFQGVPVIPEKRRPTPSSPRQAVQELITQDGLAVRIQDNEVISISAMGKPLSTADTSGFLVRDVAVNSDFYSFENGICPELGVGLEARYTAMPDHIVVEGRLFDERRGDRALTMVFALPIEAAGWRWGDDIRNSRVIAGRDDFTKIVSIKCGATGTMSVYPLAAISSSNEALALGIDQGRPAQYRLGYHIGTKQLYVAYDFGLVQETHPAGSAAFRFVLYRFEPRWGFRAAFEKFTKIFPDYFRVRSKQQGIWMPFTDVAKVEGWEDFGFKYHEGNNNVGWDDNHGVLSFRYTEPMTWWMRMPKESPRTISGAVRQRDELALEIQPERRMAQVSQVASMWDESGQPHLLFRNEPWCDGAVWSLNPNPYLPAERHEGARENGTAEITRFNAATVHWNQDIRQSLYGSSARGNLDGEYLDSLEGYVTADLNFRRDHFSYTTVPLTFAMDTKQPALFKGLAVFEFTKWFCDEIHRLGKLTFANGVPYRFTYLCPWLDVMGTETDWLRNGKYVPTTDEQMNLWRTMSGAKPYLLLMNTDFDKFTSAMVEQYFQRSLFYGVFPSMFSHNAADNPYWQNLKWYNRDRPLFKRYIPLIKRVAEAGWQPVTHATCDNPNIFVERFGPDKDGKAYFTLFNNTLTAQRGRAHLETGELGPAGPVQMRELLTEISLDATKPVEIDLEPQQAKLIELAPDR